MRSSKTLLTFACLLAAAAAAAAAAADRPNFTGTW